MPASRERKRSGRKLSIVGIGGSISVNSSSERLLTHALHQCRLLGAECTLFAASTLDLPAFSPETADRDPAVATLIAAVKEADGIIISSPGYHGAVSGLIKNILDYLELLRFEDQDYLSGKPVGCIACASGWQATTATVHNLRAIVHALRGWPTPYGATFNTTSMNLAAALDESGSQVEESLKIVAQEVIGFASMRTFYAEMHGK
jgi:FMN reductase